MTSFDATAADMETAIVASSPDLKASDVGIKVANALEFEQWEQLLISTSVNLLRSAFHLGDLLLYGAQRWGNGDSVETAGSAPRVPPERYRLAIKRTGLSYSTLQTYASVCRSIPIGQRDPRLSFEHHKAVAPLPAPQRPLWLAMAATHSDPVGVRKLRASIRLAAGSTPRIAENEELLQEKKPGGALQNYIPHLTRLLTILRKTVPEMTLHQLEALCEDAGDLVDFLKDARKLAELKARRAR